MELDWQIIINVLLGIILSVGAWLCNELWSNLKSLQTQVHKLEVDITSKYAKKDELELRFDKLEHMLNRIFDKLERKQDKTNNLYDD